MPQNILPSQHFLPLTAVNLGRFTTSITEPHRDFYDPVCDTESDISTKIQEQYRSAHQSVHQKNVASHLTAFLSSSFSRRLKADIQIVSDQAKTYYLNNAGKWFRDAVQFNETQKWIERTIDEGEDIYVVVAYHTLLNARIVERIGGQSAGGGNAAIPVSAALVASGVVVPFNENLTDVGLGGFSGHRNDEARQFIAAGEQICAVQYCKVRCRWFTRDKLDKLTLTNKTWWERYDKPRNVQSETEDSVEVELLDEFTLEEDHDAWVVDEAGEEAQKHHNT
ncbi:hypothetical protein FQN57_004573 [Myotisia sp. PD_48]|nr:hypothetical protein FQN57_004573 [Myotisia sp. PD_48]